MKISRCTYCYPMPSTIRARRSPKSEKPLFLGLGLSLSICSSLDSKSACFFGFSHPSHSVCSLTESQSGHEKTRIKPLNSYNFQKNTVSRVRTKKLKNRGTRTQANTEKKLKNRGTRTQATAQAHWRTIRKLTAAIICNQRNDKSHLIKHQRWLFKKLQLYVYT